MTDNNKIIKTNRGNLDYSSKTLIMGILNITPDSFSDGGKYNDLESALVRAKKIENAGADLIDIGAESSRPYSDRISAAEEKKRLADFTIDNSGSLDKLEESVKFTVELLKDLPPKDFEEAIS